MMKRSRMVVIYGGSFAAGVGIFLAIRHWGNSLVALGAPKPQVPVQAVGSETSGVLMHVLLALAVVIVVARVLGGIFRKMHQPLVMGEVIAGILLGPSFFGWVTPGIASQVLSASVAPYLGVISQVGI